VAVITSSRFPRETWMTQWAPWDIIDVRPASDDPAVQTITVGRRVFETALQGETGRRAVADFLAVLEDRRVALGGAGPS
jgi:hypothetical protein